jgi:hypothetical protein
LSVDEGQGNTTGTQTARPCEPPGSGFRVSGFQAGAWAGRPTPALLRCYAPLSPHGCMHTAGWHQRLALGRRVSAALGRRVSGASCSWHLTARWGPTSGPAIGGVGWADPGTRRRRRACARACLHTARVRSPPHTHTHLAHAERVGRRQARVEHDRARGQRLRYESLQVVAVHLHIMCACGCSTRAAFCVSHSYLPITLDLSWFCEAQVLGLGCKIWFKGFLFWGFGL